MYDKFEYNPEFIEGVNPFDSILKKISEKKN